jgi:pyruvate/2-oxoglutarate dehydrogenase complex dihydrolipoamide dehydrogenase (E3) component
MHHPFFHCADRTGPGTATEPDDAEVDFPVMGAEISSGRISVAIQPGDSRIRWMYLGEGHFSGPDTVEVAGKTLRFKKAVIATGTRPADPSIPGLAEAGFLTNETVFSLTERPRRLAVIGGGPIGCELAQAFRRLGSEVTLYHRAAHILNREDSDARKSSSILHPVAFVSFSTARPNGGEEEGKFFLRMRREKKG